MKNPTCHPQYSALVHWRPKRQVIKTPQRYFPPKIQKQWISHTKAQDSTNPGKQVSTRVIRIWLPHFEVTVNPYSAKPLWVISIIVTLLFLWIIIIWNSILSRPKLNSQIPCIGLSLTFSSFLLSLTHPNLYIQTNNCLGFIHSLPYSMQDLGNLSLSASLTVARYPNIKPLSATPDFSSTSVEDLLGVECNWGQKLQFQCLNENEVVNGSGIRVLRRSRPQVPRTKRASNSKGLKDHVADWVFKSMKVGVSESRCCLPFLVGAKKVVCFLVVMLSCSLFGFWGSKVEIFVIFNLLCFVLCLALGRW